MFTKAVAAVLWLVFVTPLLAQEAKPVDPPTLSALQLLKGENLTLRRTSLAARFEFEKAQAIEAISKKYQQEVQQLETERIALEAEYRTALKPKDGAVWNWTTHQFDDPKPATRTLDKTSQPKDTP